MNTKRLHAAVSALDRDGNGEINRADFDKLVADVRASHFTEGFALGFLAGAVGTIVLGVIFFVVL